MVPFQTSSMRSLRAPIVRSIECRKILLTMCDDRVLIPPRVSPVDCLVECSVLPWRWLPFGSHHQHRQRERKNDSFWSLLAAIRARRHFPGRVHGVLVNLKAGVLYRSSVRASVGNPTPHIG